ncbi:MAG TPA: glycoside hydrolase domain-containing protein [Vineibacter sp.]|nr:glycoside hydrolase domain-containing protein [Vineibacter sp.]
MTAIFAGFDRKDYPGDATMQTLWSDTNLYWCGFYLGPSYNWGPHYSKIKAMGWGVAPIYFRQAALAPILQAIKKKYENDPAAREAALYEVGRGDGAEAVLQASNAGVQPQSIIYYDREKKGTDPAHLLDPLWLTYYRGWSRELLARQFGAGLYSAPIIADWVMSSLMTLPGFDIIIPYIWVAKYTEKAPHGSAIPPEFFRKDPFPEPHPTRFCASASSWQHLGNCRLRWTELSVPSRPKRHELSPADLNTSIYRDPGRGILGAITNMA